MRTVSSHALAYVLAVVVLWPTTAMSAAPRASTNAEKRIVRQLETLADQLDRANSALDALEKTRPGVDLSHTVEAQEVARIVAAINELQGKLEGLQRSEKLKRLRARAAELERELEKLRDMGTPGLVAHPTFRRWRMVRREIEQLDPSEKTEPPAPAKAEVRLPSLGSLGRSPSTAIGLAAGITASGAAVATLLLGIAMEEGEEGLLGAGAALLGASLLAGPSAGHWYAGQGARAWGLTTARLGAYAMAVGTLLPSLFFGGFQFVLPLVSMPFLGFAIALTIIDMVDAPKAARRANRRRRKMLLQVAPTVMRLDDQVAPGLALSGRF